MSAPKAFVFWTGADGNLWQAQGPADGDLAAHNLGMGDLGSAPAAGVDSSGNNYVYWKGADGNLWGAYWNGSRWVGPTNHRMGQLGSQPTVGITQGTAGALLAFVFWQGTDGNLWMAAGPAGGTLEGPQNLGMGELGSAPAAAATLNDPYVYWKGADGNLWGAFTNGTGWTNAMNLGMGQLGSQPTAAIHESAVNVFWQGTDGNLWQAQGIAGGKLAGPFPLGMGRLGSAPAAGVDSNGNAYVYWKGTDGNLWEGYWNGTRWLGGINRGMGQLGTQPTVAVFG